MMSEPKPVYKTPLQRQSEMSAADYRAMVDAEPAKRARPNDEEHQMQCRIVDSFRRKYPLYEGLLYAIPNGAKLPYTTNKKGERVCPEAIKLKREGLQPGMMDLGLGVARGMYHGLFMELKWGKNKPSDVQNERISLFKREGYYCCVCYTDEAAEREFDWYMALPKQ